jgi:hypothetical protein
MAKLVVLDLHSCVLSSPEKKGREEETRNVEKLSQRF